MVRWLLTALLVCGVPAAVRADFILNSPIHFGSGFAISASGVVSTTTTPITLDANSVYGNPTNSPAGGVSEHLTSCSAANMAIGYSTGVGFICNTAIVPAIPAGSVTYAMLQNEGPVTLLGNTTGSPASPSEITLGAGLGFSGSTIYVPAGSITNGMLVSSAVTIGSTSVPLGSTAATIAGITLTAPVIGAATGTSLSLSGSLIAGTGSTYSINLSGASANPQIAALSGASGLLLNPNDNGTNAILKLVSAATNVTVAAVDHTGIGAFQDLGLGGSTVTLQTGGVNALVIDASQNITLAAHLTVEGVTSTGATGTGKFVFDTSPTLVTPNIGAAIGTSLITTGVISQSYDGSVNPNASYQGIASLSSSYNEIAVYGYYPTSSTHYMAMSADIGNSYLYSNDTPMSIQVDTGNYIEFDVGFSGSNEIGRFDASGLHVSGSLDGTSLGIAATDSVTTSALIHGSNRAIRMWTAASGSAYIEGVDNTGTLTYQPLIIGGSNLDFQISGATKFAINTSGHVTLEGVTSTGATGTGKFVFDGSPTLVTPVLGAASGTSLTLSSYLVAGTGSTYSVTIAGAAANPRIAALSGASSLLLSPNDNGTNAILKLVSAATNVTIAAVDNTGVVSYQDLGLGGATVTLQTGGVNALVIDASQKVSVLGEFTAAGLSTSSAATTGTLCWTTGTGNVTVDTTTTCLLSSKRFKHDWNPMKPTDTLAEVMRYTPGTFLYNDNLKIPGLQAGFLAEDMAKVDPDLVVFEENGKPLKVKTLAIIAKLASAIQEQQREIGALRAR